MKVLHAVAALLSSGSCFVKEMRLTEDAQTSSYFLPLYVGSKLERKELLVDTQANGTVIAYDYLASNSRVKKMDKDHTMTVELPSVSVEDDDGSHHALKLKGPKVTESICFSSKEDSCLDDFDFAYTMDLKALEYKDAEASGVLPFNRFGMLEDKNIQIAYDMMDEHLVYKPAVQFDFNFDLSRKDEVTKIDKKYKFESWMYANGIQDENVKYYKSKSVDGFAYFDNQIANGNWVIEIEGANIGDNSFFQKFDGGKNT
eukprot:CAMPEP_0170494034 /NCGR_PEP_ID=MMETSP0208-20121228/14404_1 /TAXON_ID=197538 /ORGANISM="Strombidium inclinatum, Strain S3" /LENGTH=257 /DNA_ID=CAMNT_0010770023 /DNA_START=14 /DNA_END=787 /DNA_ORIENTATION=-